MESPRAYLIDSSIYIFRAWFSLPDNWQSPEGWPLNAVYGYTRFLLEFLQRTDPHYCAAAFDESLGSCFRNEIFPAYKSSRELPDEALAFQLSTCATITGLLGVPCLGGPRYEADDYLASVASVCAQHDIPVSVVTRDKDLGQIIQRDDDYWWDYSADITLNPHAFEQKHGVRPDQFADYLALVGDPVDDIPGVPGIGAKTAARLLQHSGGLDQLFARIDDVKTWGIRGAARLEEKLREYQEAVMLSRQLTALETNIATVTALPQYRLTPSALDDLAAYLDDLNLGGPLVRRCKALQASVRGG